MNMKKVDKKTGHILKQVFKFIVSKKYTNSEKYEFLKDIKLACEWQMINFKKK